MVRVEICFEQYKMLATDVWKHSYLRNVSRNIYEKDWSRNQKVPVWTIAITKSQPGWHRPSR